MVRMPAALNIADVHYSIGNRQLFSGLQLEIEHGESVAVLGPSGSGKSTLLSVILGVVAPEKGSVTVNGRYVTDVSARHVRRVRAEEIGVIFQFGELLPELSPTENVSLAALLSGDRVESASDRARSLLDELGVPEAETTDTLSGGERQRTAVARALINLPSLLLADEPTGSLDRVTRDRVADVLYAEARERQCGLLVATHDIDVARRSDKVLEINDGQVVERSEASVS